MTAISAAEAAAATALAAATQRCRIEQLRFLQLQSQIADIRTVEDFGNACQGLFEAAQELQQAPPAATGAAGAQSAHLTPLSQEGFTYMLAAELLAAAQPVEPTDLPDVDCMAVDRQMIEATSQAHKSRILQAVTGWLENMHRTVDVNATDGTRHSGMWSHTVAALTRGAASASLTQQVDPDAPIREDDHHLHTSDVESELLMHTLIWQCIKGGDIDAACTICEKFGQPWKAVSLTGYSAWRDVAEEGDADGPRYRRLGNPFFYLWRIACWELSANAATRQTDARARESMDLEKTIYAVLANNVEGAVKGNLVNDWHTELWVRCKAAAESREDAACWNLRRQQFSEAQVPHASAVSAPETDLVVGAEYMGKIQDNVRSTATTIVDFLHAGRFKAEATAVFPEVQAALIRAADDPQFPQPRTLAPVLALLKRLGKCRDAPAVGSVDDGFVSNAADDTDEGVPKATDHATVIGALRFGANFVSMLFACGLLDNDGLMQDGRAIVSTYLKHLFSVLRVQDAQQRVASFTPLFAEQLPCVMYDKVRVSLLLRMPEDEETLRKRLDALHWLTFRPDHEASALLIAARILRGIVWTCDANQLWNPDAWRDAVRRAAVWKVDGQMRVALPAFLPIMLDALKLVDRALQQQLRARERVLTREILAWRSFVSAHSEYQSWFQMLKSHSDRPSAGVTARQAQAIVPDVLGTMTRAQLAIADCLKFEYGWLVPAGTAPVPDVVHSLRRACLPELVIMLHQVLHKTGRFTMSFNQPGLAEQGLQLLSQSVLVANVAADEYLELTEVMGPDSVKQLLDEIAEASLQLLHRAHPPAWIAGDV